MAEKIRALAPLGLAGLALLVWFEGYLPGADALGENLVLRFVVGLLCLFALVQYVERQQLRSVLEQMATRLQRLRAAEDGGSDGRDPAEVAHEAMSILVAALDSTDGSVRASAIANLERLSGQKFGDDAERWRQFVRAEAASAGGQESQTGLGGSTDSA